MQKIVLENDHEKFTEKVNRFLNEDWNLVQESFKVGKTIETKQEYGEYGQNYPKYEKPYFFAIIEKSSPLKI